MCYTFDLEGRYRRKSRWLEVPGKTPQPQQEYIITREELERVEVACINEYGDWLGHTNDVLFETIRSRPHASTPQKTWESCHEHFTCPNGEECWYLSEDYHKDQINAIRKRVLKDIGGYLSSNSFFMHTGKQAMVGLVDLVEYLESLRGEP